MNIWPVLWSNQTMKFYSDYFGENMLHISYKGTYVRYILVAGSKYVKPSHFFCHLAIFLERSSDIHDDVMTWKHSLHYCPFVRGIHLSLIPFTDVEQYRSLMYLFLLAWTSCWTKIHLWSKTSWHFNDLAIFLLELQWHWFHREAALMP